MKIAVPKETWEGERRVALVPKEWPASATPVGHLVPGSSRGARGARFRPVSIYPLSTHWVDG